MELPITIRGLGRYLPPDIVRNDELESRMRLPRGWIEKKTGVLERRRAAAGETASAMAARAARQALLNAGISLSEVSLILNASGTPQRLIPDNAPLFQRELGHGASGIPCFSVHSTCLSFLSAVEVAAALLSQERYEHILVLTAELPSRGLDFEQPESAVIFGDAATAAVLSRSGDDDSGVLHAFRMETYGDGADLATVRLGTAGYPYAAGSSKDALFHMDGKRIYRMAAKLGEGFFDRLVPDFSTEMAKIRAVIPHQTTMLGLHALKHYGIDFDRIVLTLPYLGNCVAASIPLTLCQAIEDGRIERGDRFLMVGTGAGLSLAAALLTY